MLKSKSPNLFLHAGGEPCLLPTAYQRAITSAKELLIVSAYLTNWNDSDPLTTECKRFRMIVGKDFGLTRKAACETVLKWLPPQHKVNFRVADQISGFHPKAVFWREADGRAYAIIGSSNLSLAAFDSNYEANIEVEISATQFESARIWVDNIAELSVPVSADWLSSYSESVPSGGKRKKSKQSTQAADVLPMHLPKPNGAAAAVRKRRATLGEYKKNRKGLIALFRRCADGRTSPSAFYDQLPDHWGGDVGGRIQGKGWERQGKEANFKKLAQSYLRILDAEKSQRDDVVVAEMDQLAQKKNLARKAFLSEMLCLEFPDRYPVLNQPVQLYLSDVKFRGASGMSEGAKYLDLALRLRLSLDQNPKHPAKNLAELDTVIWLAYPPPPKTRN